MGAIDMGALSSLSSSRPTVALPGAPQAPAAVRPDAMAVASAPAMPNPALRLDPVLGLVVVQFRDDQGKVVSTLPTERELAVYRNAGKRAANSAVPAGAQPAREPSPAAAAGAEAASGPAPVTASPNTVDLGASEEPNPAR
jgi:hypothetical protein